MSDNVKVTELPGIKGPGVAPVVIPEINKMAEAYIRERDKRMELTPKEVAAKDALIAAIHKAADDGKLKRDRDGTVIYNYDDNQVILNPGKETVKVKSVHE